MKTKSSILLAVVLATTLALSAHAQIAFTFSGTANSDDLGYVEDQAVSFTFIIADSAPIFDSEGEGSAVWDDRGDPSGRLIQTVTGTGITGSWQAPNFEGESNARLWVDVSGDLFMLSVYAYDFNPEPVNRGGLQANGFELGEITIQTLGENPFGITTLPEGGSPTEFLADYFGTYAVTGFSAEIYDIGSESSVSFSIDTITISSAAVPEPSAYAAIFGGLAFGMVIFRRRPSCV